MKKLLLLVTLTLQLFASVIQAPLFSFDEKSNTATIKVKNVDVGVSGFIVHNITSEHTSILKNVVVSSFDKEKQIATLKVSDFTGLRNNALPTGKWSVEVGDNVILAFGYSRALLIAPSEEIYYRISKSVNIQWLHPDIFATILSFNGHPTPLKEDFNAMNIATSVGLLFIYIDKKVFTVDIKSFKILTISDAPLVQDSVVLPFYTRVEEIDAAWWGEGSNELEEYEPYYYELLVKYNKNNNQLYNIIKNADKKLAHLLSEFEIKEQ